MMGESGKDPPMLDFFSTWRTVQRQQRALLRSLARWQSTPDRDLGRFGLSVTTEITTPDHSTVTVRFTLHHEGGGVMDSGQFDFDHDRLIAFVTLGDAWAPLLREFLLPSALSAGPVTPLQAPAVLDGGLRA